MDVAKSLQPVRSHIRRASGARQVFENQAHNQARGLHAPARVDDDAG